MGRADEPAVVESLRQRLRGDAELAALPLVVDELAGAIEVDRVLAYGVALGPSGYVLDFVHAAGFRAPRRELSARIAAELREARGPWAAFTPSAPEPAQRNRVVALPPFSRLDNVAGRARLHRLGIATAEVPRVARRLARLEQRFLQRIELAGAHVCRALICDGRRLLSFLGLFRERPFVAAERHLLSALVAPLHDRLIDERLRAWSRASAGSLAALLEAFPTAVFLVRDGGIVEDANAAGIAELSADPTLPALLAAAVAGAPLAQLRVHRLGDRRGCALILRNGDATEARATALAASWSLTPRQRRVATLLARGMTNKEIAAELGCSVRGVEHHLTQLLARSGCRGRTELVARFWSAGPTAH